MSLVKNCLKACHLQLCFKLNYCSKVSKLNMLGYGYQSSDVLEVQKVFQGIYLNDLIYKIQQINSIHSFSKFIFLFLMNPQLQGVLTGVYLAACGFQNAKKTTIPNLLSKITPQGGTAMRDSLNKGSQLMLKLNKVLQETGTSQHWDFVHVILTDGVDQDSKASLEDSLKMMLLIGTLIKVKSLKIIFIGVGVESVAQKELQLLAAIGGQNSEYYNVNSTQIGSIFNKIQLNLGLQKRVDVLGVTSNQGNALFVQQRVNPYLQISVKNFAIMFNLDVSGSMQGNSKWGNVCRSVNHFISKLGDGDVVSALVFNSQVKLLPTLEMTDKLFQKPKTVQPIRSKPNGPTHDKNVCCQIM